MSEDEFVEITSCPFCGCSDRTKYRSRADGLWIMLCANCQLGFVEKYPKDLQKWYRRDYYRSSDSRIGYADYAAIGYDYFLWAIALVALTDARGAIFDLGCSNGMFLDLARLFGFTELHGTELNPDYARVARGKGYTVSEVDFLDPSLQHTARFDVVTAWAVLEHIPALNRTLEKIKVMLKDDGLLFFEVPCLGFDERSDRFWATTSLEHIFYFTDASLRSILRSHFGADFVGRVVEYPGLGATIIGFVGRREPSEAHRKVGQYLKAISDEDVASIDPRKVAYYLILYVRYLADHQTAKRIANRMSRTLVPTLRVHDYAIFYLAEHFAKHYLDCLDYIAAKEYYLRQISELEQRVRGSWFYRLGRLWRSRL